MCRPEQAWFQLIYTFPIKTDFLNVRQRRPQRNGTLRAIDHRRHSKLSVALPDRKQLRASENQTRAHTLAHKPKTCPQRRVQGTLYRLHIGLINNWN